MQAPIYSEMEFVSEKKDKEGKASRLGYLRYGEKAPVIPEPHKKANCPEGWYELLAGGFVCGKYTTLDLDHPRFKLVKPPDLVGPLPYTYGVNVQNGTPLYRQVPSREERIKLEPWLVKPRKPKSDDENPYASSSGGGSSSGAAGGSLVDAGAPAEGQSVGENAGADKDTPWWQREAPDAGPPTVTLEDLQETEGPIARRMVKGFFLSLDHQFGSSGSMWWKTMSGLVAPADHIFVTKPATDFHGAWIGKDAATYPTKTLPARRIDKLPVGFILHGARRWTLDGAHKHATQAEGMSERFEAVGLTGEIATIGGVEFWETDEGWWMKSTDGTKTEPGPAPEKLGDHEKWIDVNLHRQTLVAFEGATPVYATIVSSGRNEHETVTGSFHIREKHIASTMDGDADIAADGPYSIEDVPYIEYFSGGYALHGAFWHAEFGHVKSHGCVNLAPWDAKTIFGWTDPQLPEGWHAVMATKDRPGTRVVVHERGPGTCRGPKLDACH
ncbi:MAG: L,D-transpeptidase [Polyangiaceae bacterium]